MSLTLRQIATDILKGKLPASAGKDIAKERIKLCEGCSHFTNLSWQCKLCGCFMDVKTKMLEADCPAGKW